MSGDRPESWASSSSQRPKRRHDYPEPQYITPRAPERAETPPVSPRTRPAPSYEAIRDGLEDNKEVVRAHEAARRRRDHAPVDSGVGAEFDRMQYGHPAFREAAQDRGINWQHPMITGRADSVQSPGAMFVFGAGSRPVSLAGAGEVEKMPKQRRRMWPLHPRAPRAGAEDAVGSSLPGSGKHNGAEMPPPPRPSTYDRLKKSVSGIPKSLRHLAGSKRAGSETREEPAEAERRAKKARVEFDPSPSPPHAPMLPPTRPNTPVPPLPLLAQAEIEPTPPRTEQQSADVRPLTLVLSDPEVADLIATLRLGPSFGDEREEYRPPWSRRERAEFRTYVRAAGDARWKMDQS